MRIAIVSDIHANLEALECVLEDAGRQKVDRMVSLGDNIGYGADPEAVIRLLKTEKISSVLGNHEWGCLNEHEYRWYIKDVKKSMRFTRRAMSESSCAFLKTLEFHLLENNAWFVHGFPPDSVRRYLHRIDTDELARTLDHLEAAVCFVGHTHKLGLVEKQGDGIKIRRLAPGRVQLDREKKYLINAGSVGQPRDGEPYAKYLIWELDSGVLDVRSVSYDNHRAAGKILAAGLPFRFALAVDMHIEH